MVIAAKCANNNNVPEHNFTMYVIIIIFLFCYCFGHNFGFFMNWTIFFAWFAAARAKQNIWRRNINCLSDKHLLSQFLMLKFLFLEITKLNTDTASKEESTCTLVESYRSNGSVNCWKLNMFEWVLKTKQQTKKKRRRKQRMNLRCARSSPISDHYFLAIDFQFHL